MKRWISLVLICVTVFGLLQFSSCNRKKEESEIDDSSANVGKKIICKASDFEAKRDNWYGTDELVGEDAQSIATTDLIVGEDYYFVYTFDLVYNESTSDSNVLDYELRFGLKSWDGLFYEEEAVTFGDYIETENSVYASFGRSGEALRIEKYELCSNVKTYVAVPFTPQKEGMLFIDSLVSGYGSGYTALEDKVPRVFANVLSSGADLQSSASIQISNLSYGLVGQEVYESGQLENTSDLASISKMEVGRNYVVVDFDVTSDSEASGEVYCGIYMHKGDWEDVTLEQANTAKFNQSEMDGGKIFDFSYSVPQNGGTKSVRTVLSFNTLDICSIDFEFFVYSDNTRVSGSLYDCDNFADASVSALKMRVEPNTHKCYVTGYETMTGNVVIPGFYQGYRVVEVEERAFENCQELTFLDLNKVSTVNYRAFAKCNSLTKIDLGNVKTVGESAFSECQALKSIYIPESVLFINSGAFEGCGLGSAQFANPFSWSMASSKGDEILVMNYPSVAAEWLTKTYAARGMAFEPTLEIDNVKIGFVEESVYESGAYEDQISRDWEKMSVIKTYYWILDFDATVLSTRKGYHWSVFFKNTDGYNISLKDIEGVDTDWYESSSDFDNGTYGVYIGFDEKAEEPTHIRLIFKVDLEMGNRRMEYGFGANGAIKHGGAIAEKLPYDTLDISVGYAW